MPFISRFLLASHFHAAIAVGNRLEVASKQAFGFVDWNRYKMWRLLSKGDVIDLQPVKPAL